MLINELAVLIVCFVQTSVPSRCFRRKRGCFHCPRWTTQPFLITLNIRTNPVSIGSLVNVLIRGSIDSCLSLSRYRSLWFSIWLCLSHQPALISRMPSALTSVPFPRDWFHAVIPSLTRQTTPQLTSMSDLKYLNPSPISVLIGP